MSRNRALLVLLIILTLFSSPVYSQGYENPSMIKLTFRLIVNLVIFIAVILLALYGTKLVAKNSKGIGNSKYIQLLDAINIPGGSKIIIAKINNQVYILSSGNNGTNLIDKIQEEDFPMDEEDYDTYIDKYLANNKLNFKNINQGIKSFFNEHMNQGKR